jgi:porin
MINYSCIPNSSLTTWYRRQLVTVGIATLFLVLMMPAGPNSAAQETENKTLIQELSTPELQTGESNLSGYKNTGFGGPDSVGGQLQTENEFKDTAVRIQFLKRALRPWFDFKKRVKEKLGLQYGLTYTSLYQVATKSLNENQAAGGIFALQVQWDLLGRKSPNTGSLIFQLQNRHRLGTKIPPNSLFKSLGSSVSTAKSFSDFGWAVTDLHWQQLLFNRHAGFAIGKLHLTDYLDLFALSSSKTGFMNKNFSENPAIAFPKQGLGANIFIMPNNNLYLLAGLADANGDPRKSGFNTFFDEAEYFTAVEIGWISSFDKRTFDNIHITGWHSDKRKNADVPKGYGVAMGAEWRFREKWLPFFRAGWSNGDASSLEAHVSGGLGVYLKSHDVVALGLNWGKPSSDGQRDEYTMELFYRIQVTQILALTPDIQLIIDPSNNPDDDFIAVFGLRARLAL